MSSPTTSSFPTTMRSSLGPLTTTFTLPQECSIYGVMAEDQIRYFAKAQDCSGYGLIDTSTCWPSVPPSLFVEKTLMLPNEQFLGLGFYSPGLVCPSGFTSACTAASVLAGEPFPQIDVPFVPKFPLEPGETAVGCCPT